MTFDDKTIYAAASASFLAFLAALRAFFSSRAAASACFEIVLVIIIVFDFDGKIECLLILTVLLLVFNSDQTIRFQPKQNKNLKNLYSILLPTLSDKL